MKTSNLKRFMASLLAVVMIFSVVGISPAVFADDAVAPELNAKSGEVLIKSSMTNEEVSELISKALISNYDELDDATKAALQWEYYCEGKNGLLTNDAWGSINGFTSTKKIAWKEVTYTHAALKDAKAGDYQVRLAGTKTEATLVKVDKYTSIIALNKEVTEIGLTYNADNTINYDALAQRIFDVLVNTAACTPTITRDDVTIEYAYAEAFGEKLWTSLEGGTILPALKEGTNDIKITFNGNDAYKATEATHTANFVDNRIASSIVYKDGAQITYNMEASVMEEAIINSVIDHNASALPENVSASDFTIEYYGSHIDVFGKEHNAWVSIAGGRDGIYDYSQMGAGEQKIRVSFNGNAEYKPCGAAEYTLTVNKADVKVTINDPIKIMYAGEAIDSSEYVSIDPKDPALDVYIVYVGVNTNKQTTVYLQLTGNKEDFVNGINALLKFFDLPTLNDGMTVGEFKAAVNKALSLVDNKLTEGLVNWALKDYGITYKDLKGLMEALNKITIADNLLFAIGAPAHAGQYFATAIAVNDNYNTGISTPGSVTVLKNWKGIKLAKNPILDSNNNTITVSQAEELAKGNDLCILTKDGAALDSTSVGSIHYWFTGVGKLYAKSTMPTAPGKYIVTASVRGGDFFAMPKTFTFTIVADPTPEVTPEA